MRLTKLALAILAIGVWFTPPRLYGQRQAIDVNRSSLKIRVFKSGMFSAFAHDHEIQARIDQGSIDSSASPAVQLHLDSRRIRVLDPEVSVKDRVEIQKTMQGPSVLDTGPMCRKERIRRYRPKLPEEVAGRPAENVLATELSRASCRGSRPSRRVPDDGESLARIRASRKPDRWHSQSCAETPSTGRSSCRPPCRNQGGRWETLGVASPASTALLSASVPGFVRHSKC